MSKTHKAQHYVPRCYLSAWIDPIYPSGYEPYVWVFPREGGNERAKAPQNVFTENEIYTIHHADGKRDLRVEHGLKQLEDWFVEIRREFLSHKKNIPSQRRVKLMAFVAALRVELLHFVIIIVLNGRLCWILWKRCKEISLI